MRERQGLIRANKHLHFLEKCDIIRTNRELIRSMPRGGELASG